MRPRRAGRAADKVDNLTGAGVGLGLMTIAIGLWWLLHTARKIGYADAANRIYEDVRMYREDDGQIFRDLVPGLTEAMYIARFHEKNYNTEPTGLSRSRRPSPVPDGMGRHRH